MKSTLLTFLLIFTFTVESNHLHAQRELPYMSQKSISDANLISDLSNFVPTTDDFTLEMQGTAKVPIELKFLNVSYSPSIDAIIRFVQKNNKIYVFENGVFKTIFEPQPVFELTGENIIQNPGFEETEELLSAGRWKPKYWDTWNGGMPTWGGDIGKTNVRENNNYRSEGVKSIIMHSESHQLLQKLTQGALIDNEHYFISYDFWTSTGAGNGGAIYKIILKSHPYTGEIQTLKAHTTKTSGTEKSTFTTIFQANKDMSDDVWFVLERNESKVDWLDNFKLFKITTEIKGLSGTSSATYLPGIAYAPENLTLENGDYIDMTEKIDNSSFDEALNGWTINAPGAKISTTQKAGGLIGGNQNHLQFWVSGGGITGGVSQTIIDLPNGKYKLQATVVPNFTGTIALFANRGKTNILNGVNKEYDVSAVVFNGQLEFGIDMQTSGSPTIDIDEFNLFYWGIDVESYLQVLTSNIQQAIADTLSIRNSSGLPGYNNIQQYRDALQLAENRTDDKVETLIFILNSLNAAILEYENILNSYLPLKSSITELKNRINTSEYPDLTDFTEELMSAQAVYEGDVDSRNIISSIIQKLTLKLKVLDQYEELKQTIVNAQNYLDQTQYEGSNIFNTAISNAQLIVDYPVGKDLAQAIKDLRIAKTTYYNSQYTTQPTKNVISWVDTSMNNSEKYVLVVDGQPVYLSNIQVRLDKLYGYHGWSDTALEAVIKRAADDGFNTVSIPIHWREVEPVKDEFDWTTLDKYLGWCKKYNLKMELLWFSWSSGGRVQYLMNFGGIQSLRTPDYVCSLEGKSEFNMLQKNWEYSLDWRDINLRNRETYVLSKVMEQVALWDANNGNPHTVIGVQLGNEAHNHGANNATYPEIIEYYHHVGSAVKNSKYVVWNRLNAVSWMTSGKINANETKRKSGGTNIDFVGIDIYGTNASSIKSNMNGQLPHTGKNYSMIMEIDARDANTPLYQMAAISGNKGFCYYNMGFVDGNGLYTNNGTVLQERSHIDLVRQRNKLISLANQDIALKTHGVSLYVYNYAGNTTASETGLDNISFTPGTNTTQAITIRRSKTELILLATSSGTFNLPTGLTVVSASRGYFNKANKWVNESELTVLNNKVLMPYGSSAVLITLEQNESQLGIQNNSFENGTINIDGINVPVSWKLDKDLSGADIKLSNVSAQDGQYKYNVWASSISSINLYQDIELRKGNYRLIAAMRTGSQADVSTQHIYAQAQGEEPVTSTTLSFDNNKYWQDLELEFNVLEDFDQWRIGASSTGNGTTSGWFQVDNFRLEKTNINALNHPEEASVTLIAYGSYQGMTIHLNENTRMNLDIYSITGQKIISISIYPGINNITLEKGIYIVNNQKVIVL